MNGLVAARGDVYDVGAMYVGAKPPVSQIVCFHVFNRLVTFPAAFKGSNGRCKTTATAQADFDVKKNGASIGTIRFAAGATRPTFLLTPAQRFVAGDYLEVVAPGSQDATLQDISFLLAGQR